MLQEVITASEGKDCVDELRRLLSADGNRECLNAIDAFGDTALHLAAQDGYSGETALPAFPVL